MGTKIYTISVVWYLPSCNAGGRERFETIRELFFSERAATIRLEYLNNYSEGVEYVMGEMVTRDILPMSVDTCRANDFPPTRQTVHMGDHNRVFIPLTAEEATQFTPDFSQSYWCIRVNAPETVTSYGKPSTKTYVRGRGNNDGTQAAWLNRTTKTWLVLSFNGVLGEFRFCRQTGVEIGFSKMSQHARWIPEEELRRLNEGFPGVNRKV
jgi:hypothetical protein